VVAYRYAPGGEVNSLNAARAAGMGGAQRIVSLGPGITEVLFALGVGDRVVGRTDFCSFPPKVTTLPTAGTGISPNYEALVGMNPDLILTESSRAAQIAQLRVIADTRALTWLTLDDAATSLKVVGALVGAEAQAAELAQNFRRTLGVPAPEEGLRVLLLLGLPSEGTALWFAKRNSLHGRTLHAAGLRNAVPEEISGAPSMSFERLVEVNPEAIVVMLAKDSVREAERKGYLEFFARFPMIQAVRNKAIRFLPGKGYFNNGPRLLELVEALKRAIAALPVAEEAP
jgi:iron complex transport system substrate-binding protein